MARVGLLAVRVTQTLLIAGASAAEAQAALLIALQGARMANLLKGEPGTNDEAERLAREFHDQAAAGEPS